MTPLPFVYRTFYDVPRYILVEWRATWLYLDCSFNEERDVYSDFYDVYELDRPPSDDPSEGEWSTLRFPGKRCGRIRVADVSFDLTRRKLIDSSVFERFDAGHDGRS